jgi:hypothetical protein
VKKKFSTYPPPTMIRMSNHFTSVSKPVTQRSFECCLSHFHTSVSNFALSAKRLAGFSTQLRTVLREKHFPLKQEIFLYKYQFHLDLFLQKTHNSALFTSSTLLKQGLHFDYWNSPLDMSMCDCYLHWHEAGLYCYILIHTEITLHLLRLFYFNS